MEHKIMTPSGTIIVRPGQEADAPAYRELRLEALRNHPEAFSADYESAFQQPANEWAERLRSLGGDNMIYFAAQKDALIGMCGIYRGKSAKTHHSATIWGVYVKAEWRGLQIADVLMDRCIEWARDQGIKIVRLAVVTTNQAAIRCYERCEFKIYGTSPQEIFYNGRMYDELLMARVL
jgi:RimJ/RimL family protein N-acetyltransferase